MSAVWTRLRDAVSATRRAEEAERQRDDARQARDAANESWDVETARADAATDAAREAHQSLETAHGVLGEIRAVLQGYRYKAGALVDLGSDTRHAFDVLNQSAAAHAERVNFHVAEVRCGLRTCGYEQAVNNHGDDLASMVREALVDKRGPAVVELEKAQAALRVARDDARRARDVLAPDVDTSPYSLAEVAQSGLSSAVAVAVAEELHWWAARMTQAGLEEALHARARELNPGGVQPRGDQPPTPTAAPREAYDPAMGGDIEPPPGRPPRLLHRADCGCFTCQEGRRVGIVETPSGYTPHGVLTFDGLEPTGKADTSGPLADLVAEILGRFEHLNGRSGGWYSMTINDGLMKQWRDRLSALSPVVDAKIMDASTVWSGEVAPGGYVCGACRMPVESEPCREHQPNAYARISS